MRIEATAPGKVALLGEYAVLEGAPALVMAINRRVRVSLAAHERTFCSVSAPEWAVDTARFELGPAGAKWMDGNSSRYDLAAHVIRAFFERRRHSAACPPFHLILDSTSLMEKRPSGPAKLGLGSSAALTVALCNALGYYVASQQDSSQPPDLDELIDTHAGFQHRRGSGLDVAASLYGGLIEYRRAPVPLVRPSQLPADVEFCFVWSGRQAATGRFLAKIDQWRRGNRQRYQRLTDTLAQASEAGVRAAGTGDGDEFLRIVDEYAAGLQALGRASGADILSEPHRRLGKLARRCQVVYKPCGAGGGDIGVAMSRDPATLARFLACLEPESFKPLSLQIDRSGVETRSGN